MDPSIRAFWQASSQPLSSPSEQEQGVVPQPPLELPYDSDAGLIDLPALAGLTMPSCDVRSVIEQRRTVRKYADSPISLAELSYLLWCTQGVREVTSRPATLRTVPSAGARHAFETLLLVNRVESLAPGLYRFLAIEHKLLPLNLSDALEPAITAACGDQDQITRSAVTFFWAAVAHRMTWRYQERGYRYLLLDAGHVCQNLFLTAESLGCGVCPIGAFEDAKLNAALNLDGEEQFAIYGATLGRKL